MFNIKDLCLTFDFAIGSFTFKKKKLNGNRVVKKVRLCEFIIFFNLFKQQNCL